MAISRSIHHGALHAEHGDITRFVGDAVVNAANERLAGGGGVDGAIHRAAGPSLMQECDRIRARDGGCKTGSAVLTGAGDLAVRHVIHTVGPVWRDGDSGEPALLRSCYEQCLALAEDHDLKSIAFPAISCGVYSYPLEDAAAIAVGAAAEFLRAKERRFSIHYLLFDEESYEAYRTLFAENLQPA